MNPDANVNLPPSNSEAAPAIPEQAAALQLAPVRPPAAPGQLIQPSHTAATNGQSNSSPMLPFTNNPAVAQAEPTPASIPVDDSDDDSLEAEWVNKAKQIVTQTVNDPFEQNRQLSAVKADYLLKRYGKVIKLAE